MSKRLKNNVDGDFFVDYTCINCDACRQIAPDVFAERNGYSAVIKQPEDGNETRETMRAVIACPSGSIGFKQDHNRREVRKDFPLQLDEDLYYCGFNSPKSYGGNSYFVTHRSGNWLIDAPRYTPYLVDKFERMGGIDHVFLTHRDDIADVDKYAEYFDCTIYIHEGDKLTYPSADRIIKGEKTIEIGDNILIIPTPGHTRGHMVLLIQDKYLFTGDHLYWKRRWNGLRATRKMCWYDWDQQVDSMEKLLNYTFEWVLPGHGQRKKLESDKMKEELKILVNKMNKEDYW